MQLHDLTVGDGVWLSYTCRDIGYGVEEGSGEFLYRGREQFGKYTFDNCDTGEVIYLFEDEIYDLERIERQLYKVTIDVYLKPKKVTWKRWAFSERQAKRQAVDSAAIEWPEAKLIECSAESAAV